MLKEVLKNIREKKITFDPDSEKKLIFFLYKGKLYGDDPRLPNNVTNLEDVKNRKILQKKY